MEDIPSNDVDSRPRGFSAGRSREALQRVGMAAGFLCVAALSNWLHGPLFDSCEPSCSTEFLLHSNLRVPAAEPLVYGNGLFLYILGGIAAIGALSWRPLSRRPGAVLLVILAMLVILDSWLMRYW